MFCYRKHLVAPLFGYRCYFVKNKSVNNMCESVTPADQRNVEVKARIPGGSEGFEKRLILARNLSGSQDAQLIEQRDVFFESPLGGRLKLRYLQAPSRSQLVYYDRPDVAGPKLSKFNKTEVDEPEVLEKILRQSNGVLGVLAKRRHLFLCGQTRIHLDEVKDLGHFMELEVCLTEEQTLEEGQAIAEKLSRELGIQEEDLMTGSYFDALRKLNH
ncbi:uncharacterized protein LOC122623566 [Drosophila teissieri]|uniref:uncharacterized protein LOC122623566 n=1 Tax=Drosophila teissieri TaxID=7243 RepID=UPI001CB9EA2E|nr:uncharacterized protein LOC122623566 [Drosophila teissieri]